MHIFKISFQYVVGTKRLWMRWFTFLLFFVPSLQHSVCILHLQDISIQASHLSNAQQPLGTVAMVLESAALDHTIATPGMEVPESQPKLSLSSLLSYLYFFSKVLRCDWPFPARIILWCCQPFPEKECFLEKIGPIEKYRGAGSEPSWGHSASLCAVGVSEDIVQHSW